MAKVAIPAWTANGVIPPINPTAPTSAERSPYAVTLCDFVLRFATSPKRVQILDGFLRYRARLHAIGLRAGFQWLNGSFHENVEVNEGRDPNAFFSTSLYLSLDPAARTGADPLLHFDQAGWRNGVDPSLALPVS